MEFKIDDTDGLWDGIRDIQELLIQFRDDRDWAQFHKPKELAGHIMIESAELLDCFGWQEKYDSREVANELADIWIYTLTMAYDLGIDFLGSILKKLKINEKNYPIEVSKGNCIKNSKKF
jgi:dCTP diphosphatase